MYKGNIKILFIDDNEPNNVLTQAIIEAEGLPIEGFYAQSIDEAIALLYEFEKNNGFPKLIFCDIKLPVKDGYYFAKYYLEHFYENHKNVNMYFMSADFQPEQSDELTEFPFVYNVYTKPFSLEIFNDAVDEIDSNVIDDLTE